MNPNALQRMADRADILDCLSRYARGVDRGDWALVRSTYHSDAIDQHGEYRGDVDGLIGWLEQRFAGVDNSMHFLGNCLIDFASTDFAFVECYFGSSRLREPSDSERAERTGTDMMCRQAWGRYLDHFERRGGEWRVANRVVVVEASYTSVALGGRRSPDSSTTWGSRTGADLFLRSRAELFAKAVSKT